MQQPPGRAPSPGASFFLAALLGIPSAINLVMDLATGANRGNAGSIVCSIAALAYALLLVRDALHIKKTGRPAIPQKRMFLASFGLLAVYLGGLFLKHSG